MGAAPLKILLVSLAVACAVCAPTRAAAQGDPELLTFDELLELSQQETPSAALQKKLTALLTTPFVNNSASREGVAPLKPVSPDLGPLLRVVAWNIERGLELDTVKLAFTDPRGFLRQVHETGRDPAPQDGTEVAGEAALLPEADVLVLNEVDWGMKRTRYANVVEELAAALGMNYAYGVEFVEIDPLSLGTETFDGVPEKERAALVENIQVDRARYKGLHGSAVLSRYRLDNVRLVPYRVQGHDWYGDEKKQVTRLEWGKRTLGEKVFLEKVTREVRRGGRMMLLADIADPDLPGGKVTIVATHLEARTEPAKRVLQLNELLRVVQPIANPVILAGDMNTSTKDTTPTSIQREIKKRLGSEDFWLKQGLKYATGIGLLFDVAVAGSRFVRAQADPTVRSVPIVAPNPEGQLFARLEQFRFADGGAFDFRGESRRAFGGRAGTLANSNQREKKGFAITYQVARGRLAGRFKLDWIFVKPPATSAAPGATGPHLFAPHFGRTLERLNDALPDGISDHNPVLVDLPLKEPGIHDRP